MNIEVSNYVVVLHLCKFVHNNIDSHVLDECLVVERTFNRASQVTESREESKITVTLNSYILVWLGPVVHVVPIDHMSNIVVGIC